MSDEATFIGLVYDNITKVKECSHTTSYVPGYTVYRRWTRPIPDDQFLTGLLSRDDLFVYRDFGVQGSGIYKESTSGSLLNHT